MIDRKLRRGDVVSLRATVNHNVDAGDEHVHVIIEGFKRIVVEPSTIVSFLQPKVEVDDRVHLGDDKEQGGVVRGVFDYRGGVLLWVETPNGMVTWLANHVEVEELLPEEPPMPPAKND